MGLKPTVTPVGSACGRSWKRMKMACECGDRACPVHRGATKCKGLGLIILRDLQDPDSTGKLMCARCRDRALESGRFDAGRLGARASFSLATYPDAAPLPAPDKYSPHTWG